MVIERSHHFSAVLFLLTGWMSALGETEEPPAGIGLALPTYIVLQGDGERILEQHFLRFFTYGSLSKHHYLLKSFLTLKFTINLYLV